MGLQSHIYNQGLYKTEIRPNDTILSLRVSTNPPQLDTNRTFWVGLTCWLVKNSQSDHWWVELRVESF